MLLFRLWNFLIEQIKLTTKSQKRGEKKRITEIFFSDTEKKKEEENKFSSKEKRSESIHFKSRYGKN